MEAGAATINVAALITALTSAVTAGDVVTLMASVVTAGIGFVLVWFGGRKVIRSFSAALKSGKLKI